MNKVRDFFLKILLLIIGLSTLIGSLLILLVSMFPSLIFPNYVLLTLGICLIIWAVFSLATVLCIIVVLICRSIKFKENFFDNLKKVHISL